MLPGPSGIEPLKQSKKRNGYETEKLLPLGIEPGLCETKYS